MIFYYTNNFLKNYENVLNYNISLEIFMSSKSLHVRFYKIDEFIKIHDGIKYLVLLSCTWFD